MLVHSGESGRGPRACRHDGQLLELEVDRRGQVLGLRPRGGEAHGHELADVAHLARGETGWVDDLKPGSVVSARIGRTPARSVATKMRSRSSGGC